MKYRRIVAHEIYKVRMELDIKGDEEHDWWLAEQFIEFIGDDRFDYDDIYVWFVQLDENMV